MKQNRWFINPFFYGIIGLLTMILVIWVARTNVFYLCYFPLFIAASLVSGHSNPEKGILLPSKKVRLLGFVAGMIVCEFIFSLILIFQDQLSLQFNSTQRDWAILAIELLLGVAVFIFFFGALVAASYFLRKIKQRGPIALK